MSNKLKTLVVLSAMAVVMTGSKAFAANDIPPLNATPSLMHSIAVVDVQKVVASSSQVAALKKEQETKAKSLIEFIEKARKDVAATTDTKKKAALEEKYTKELNNKKEAIDKAYAEKLKTIDNNITKQIETTAKNGGYSIILAKGVVLYGGTDITDQVIKAVK